MKVTNVDYFDPRDTESDDSKNTCRNSLTKYFYDNESMVYLLLVCGKTPHVLPFKLDCPWWIYMYE